jgi:uncharacterized membrane protein
MNKFQFFLEIVWLLVGVFAIITAGYEIYMHGTGKSYQLFAIAAIAFGVYFLRRYVRKKKR